MKSSKTLYFLLPAVLVVWGLIGYRFFDLTRDEVFEASPIYIASTSPTVIIKESKELILDYPDPFIRSINSIESSTIKATVQESMVIKEDPYKDWARIRYQGLIRNSKRNTNIAILEINGFKEIAESGESISGYFLTAITADSIRIKFKENQRWIRVE